MRREMKCGAIGLLVLLLTLPLPGLARGASDEGTVLSASGEVQVKGPDGGDWQRLNRGAKIAGGSRVKTGSDAFARILSPAGTLIKIPAGREEILSFSPTAPDEPDTAPSPGYSEFVAEFFSPNQRTRINAVRSHLTPLQQDWVAFARFNHLSPDSIEAALELAAAFQAENRPNRSVYILWKLRRFFPDDPGLRALADRAVRALESTGEWAVNDISVLDRPLPAEDDALQIAFRTPEERYVYLYHTRRSPAGMTTTRRLFPDTDDLMALSGRTFFASRVAAEETLSAMEDGVAVRADHTPFAEVIATLDKGTPVTVLEKRGRRYRIAAQPGVVGWTLKHKLAGDSAAEGKQSGDALAVLRVPTDAGGHYLWGWAAPGPMPPWAVERVLARVRQVLSADDAPLTRETIEAALPEIGRDVRVLLSARR